MKKLAFKAVNITDISEATIRQNCPVDLSLQPDLILDGNYTYANPIYAKDLTIKSTCVFTTTQMTKVIIWAETITIEAGAQINLDGKGFFGGRNGSLSGISDLQLSQSDTQFAQWLTWLNNNDYEGWQTQQVRPPLGYVPGFWQAAISQGGGAYNVNMRRGGDNPQLNKPGVNRTMQGLINAVATLASNYGAGANGILGAGGGGGSDGAGGQGGGSGAGGGGGSASNGIYASPRGGNGSQADPTINLTLFKNWQIDEIPLFGGGGGYGYTLAVGGDGGGSIQMYAAISINIAAGANITCKGTAGAANGTFHRGGGGGGGSILIATPNFTNNGILNVDGGLGASGSYPGGNGGTGLILLNTERIITPYILKLKGKTSNLLKYLQMRSAN